MNRRSILATAVATIFAAAISTAQTATQAPPSQGPKQPAATKLTGMMAAVQGTWVMSSANGQDVAGSGQDVSVTITNNTYVQSVNGQVVEKGTFKLDETKKPATLDISIVEGPDAGSSQFGVIVLKDNIMTVKLAGSGTTTRPADFVIADGYEVLTFVKKQ